MLIFARDFWRDICKHLTLAVPSADNEQLLKKLDHWNAKKELDDAEPFRQQPRGLPSPTT